MPIYDDTLEIRLASPDYQEDWGVVGDPVYVTLDRYRRQAGVLELCIDADSPVRELLMRESCAVQVKFRGQVEFLGHVYHRAGKGVARDSPLVFYARDETETFDHTLAWVMPRPLSFPGSFGGLYSSGKIEAEQLTDSAQAFPDPWLDPGHYMWTMPYHASGNPGSWWDGGSSPTARPQTVGAFLAPLLFQNLERVGYTRGSLFFGSAQVSSNFFTYLTAAGQVSHKVISDSDRSAWVDPLKPVPWVSSFTGIAPRFQTLREVVSAFQAWADEHTETSFNVFSQGEIGVGAFGIRIGLREGQAEYPVPLSVDAGTVINGEWSIGEHTGSRVILGGPGEQEARLFQERRISEREASGRVIEIFKDATGAKLMAVNKEGFEGFPREYFVTATVADGYKTQARGYFNQQGERYLAEAAPETTVSFELQESGEIYYGGESGYQLGQLLTIDLGWMQFVKRLERVSISLTRTDGIKVIPFVGSDVATSDEAAARAMRALADNQRRNNSER